MHSRRDSAKQVAREKGNISLVKAATKPDWLMGGDEGTGRTCEPPSAKVVSNFWQQLQYLHFDPVI